MTVLVFILQSRIRRMGSDSVETTIPGVFLAVATAVVNTKWLFSVDSTGDGRGCRCSEPKTTPGPGCRHWAINDLLRHVSEIGEGYQPAVVFKLV
jgi:hypothetical protein